MAEPRLIRTTIDSPEAKVLVDAISADYLERYGEREDIDPAEELARYPAELMTSPYGGFYLLELDGEIVAGGGFMYLDDETAEIKRVWTSAAHRRRGLSRRIITLLESEIVARGYRNAYLTTGPLQPEAKAMYLHLGFTPLYDTTVDSTELPYLGFEKVLAPDNPGVHVPKALGERAERHRRILAALEDPEAGPITRLRDL
ncbi:GNAT family N-acetyltransferase [Corynebacterium guangdongense]|uniref:GNAT superfamily N-acetyltransferase n=1 Tax=Corynebacterium guangdongense TaxID=1783348 RepID=A0ABU2A0A0_9CORY|nr:GNAT family N-acetyltransferase [Corynebacterium guangdongense]MDR7329568.1 GNAT superfamily N-acetyltransferase [Corynebacterium guangdongense]WJZ18133.1 Acetyltransferase (GNAT) family protein [Corynebacterium guangdongense]